MRNENGEVTQPVKIIFMTKENFNESIELLNIKKEILNPQVISMDIEAPLVANKAKAGQFVILRPKENSERIPLTIADYNREEGILTVVYMAVGYTTKKSGVGNQKDTVRLILRRA